MLSEANKQAIEANINEQLNLSADVERTIKEARQEAATKIYSYWIRKRQILIERKEAIK